ncbi:MAG: amidohydrolase family protein [Acidobacteria bacterium]|nr:amidohydrolase family protein [Acidobacteriota bacterium]
MSKLLLKGGRVVDPANGLDDELDVLVVDGAIAAIAPELDSEDCDALEATGMIVAPGFVDMHVHLREPGFEYKETIESGMRAAAAGGFCGIACMPNTEPINDHRSVTELILDRASVHRVHVYPIGAVSVGQRGEALAEIGELVDAGCRAVSDDGFPVATAQLMRKALEYTQIFDIVVIDHCEEVSMTHGSVMHEGAVSAELGLRGWPAAAEEITVSRDLILADSVGGRLHLAHLSTRGSMDLVRNAKAGGSRATCEVMTHHFSLTEEAVRHFDTNTKMNPPLRSEDDRQAILDAIADGTVDIIATDHAPHHADEKLLEFDHAPFGIVGLETAIPLACTHLVHAGVIDVARLVEMMSTNPARILGVDRGGLRVDAPADITIIDLDAERAVNADTFESRSSNTPFHGTVLKGWPVATIIDGEVVYSAKESSS